MRALAIAQALEGASRADAARFVGPPERAAFAAGSANRCAVLRCVGPRGSPDNAEGLAGLHDRPRPGQLTAAQRAEINPVERVWLYLRERFLLFRLHRSEQAIVDALCAARTA